MINIKKVIVTGSRGLLGSAICGALNQMNDVEVVALSRDDCDLRKVDEVESLFAKIKPDWVFIVQLKLAALRLIKIIQLNFF